MFDLHRWRYTTYYCKRKYQRSKRSIWRSES